MLLLLFHYNAERANLPEHGLNNLKFCKRLLHLLFWWNHSSVLNLVVATTRLLPVALLWKPLPTFYLLLLFLGCNELAVWSLFVHCLPHRHLEQGCCLEQTLGIFEKSTVCGFCWDLFWHRCTLWIFVTLFCRTWHSLENLGNLWRHHEDVLFFTVFTVKDLFEDLIPLIFWSNHGCLSNATPIQFIEAWTFPKANNKNADRFNRCIIEYQGKVFVSSFSLRFYLLYREKSNAPAAEVMERRKPSLQDVTFYASAGATELWKCPLALLSLLGLLHLLWSNWWNGWT